MDTGSSASSTLRVGGERPGERDPLALAAGQLVRVLGQELLGRREPHLLHQGDDLLVYLHVSCPGAASPAARGGSARCAPGSARRTDPGRPAGPGSCTAGSRCGPTPRPLALQLDRAGGQAFLAGQQPGGRRLTRAALAHQGDDGAAVEVEGDITYRMQGPAAGRCGSLCLTEHGPPWRAVRVRRLRRCSVGVGPVMPPAPPAVFQRGGRRRRAAAFAGGRTGMPHVLWIGGAGYR